MALFLAFGNVEKEAAPWLENPLHLTDDFVGIERVVEGIAVNSVHTSIGELHILKVAVDHVLVVGRSADVEANGKTP
jgi:hypothetical protein